MSLSQSREQHRVDAVLRERVAARRAISSRSWSRRVIAAVAILVVLILVVVGVHSCQVSARNTSLKDYANNISSAQQASRSTTWRTRSSASSRAAGGSSNASGAADLIDRVGGDGEHQLNRAKGLDVPDEMKGAQQQFLLAMQMRHDGIADIAANIQQALGNTTSKDAINAIAADMARFYASDVIYKDYATAPGRRAPCNNAGIAVGGANGVQLDEQPVPHRPRLALADLRRRQARCLAAVLEHERPGCPRHARPLA